MGPSPRPRCGPAPQPCMLTALRRVLSLQRACRAVCGAPEPPRGKRPNMRRTGVTSDGQRRDGGGRGRGAGRRRRIPSHKPTLFQGDCRAPAPASQAPFLPPVVRVMTAVEPRRSPGTRQLRSSTSNCSPTSHQGCGCKCPSGENTANVLMRISSPTKASGHMPIALRFSDARTPLQELDG